MATCAHCNTKETELYEYGVPICLECCSARKIKRKPANSDDENIREKLHRDLLCTTDRKEVGRAHNRLNDYLARGIVPEDLKEKAKTASAA